MHIDSLTMDPDNYGPGPLPFENDPFAIAKASDAELRDALAEHAEYGDERYPSAVVEDIEAEIAERAAQ
jgi:hypothetical protein